MKNIFDFVVKHIEFVAGFALSSVLFTTFMVIGCLIF